MKELEMMLDTPEKRLNFITIVSQIETGVNICGRLFEKDEARRDIQKRLDWRWNGEIARNRQDEDADYYHGFSKYTILLPMLYEWAVDDEKMRKRTEFLDALFNSLRYELKILAAYDSIRSKDISVKQFAEYLTRKQRYWAEKGVQLTSSEDLYFKALGRAA